MGIDHLRRGDPGLVDLLQDLPAAAVAEDDEALRLIECHLLFGKRVGYVDVHLLASAALTDAVLIWTRDKKLRVIAQALGCACQDAAH